MIGILQLDIQYLIIYRLYKIKIINIIEDIDINPIIDKLKEIWSFLKYN